ncbi:MAG: PAS domain-containing protein [Bacteroidales bacterium]|nr:PAS domain-containing protein [Bacteroidales bacterium]
MGKLPSYEDLQKKIVHLEKELSKLYSSRSEIPSNINPILFFKISENSRNAIALFETTDNGETFVIKYFNKKAEETEKVKREKIIGRKLSVAFPSVLKSGFHDALKRVFLHNTPEEFASTIVLPGEIIEWKHNYIYKLSEKEIVSIYIDETEKKKQEFEHKLNQEKLQIAMDAANYYTFEVNLLTREITTNHELYYSLGFSNEDILLLTEKIGSLLHPEDSKILNQFLDTPTKENLSEFHTEFRIKNKKGKWVWFMSKGKAVEFNKKGDPLRVVGLLKDIQRDKELLLKLKSSEENFLQLSENINDAFWLRTLDQRILFANPACVKIVGKDFLRVFQDFEHYKTWIHPEDRKRIIKIRENNLKFPDKNYHYEHRIIGPNNEVRWVWIRTFPVFDEKGEVYRRAGIASDITEQKKLISDLLLAKEKAEESDNLKSAFLANMSHEIRTPMNGILGFAELLKEESITEKEKEEYLKIINSNGKQLLSLINDIIDVAKIEATQITINKSFTELNPLLKETYQLFTKEQKRLKKQDIRLELKIPFDDNNKILTDVIRLQQILNNLLSNAFKFTKTGSISFGYEIINNNGSAYYQFFVADTGIGIDKNMQGYIFERFGQVLTKNLQNKQGTGLGLAISKGLIELLGGKIWLESSPENTPEGISGSSIFYFTIPINQETNTDDLTNEILKPKKEMKTLDDLNILVVEDDRDNLEFLSRLLAKHGANVVAANSGEEAIKIIKSNNQIQIVLMDIRLPDIDGFETTKIIKKLKPSLPVIAQTAYAMYNDREKCLENGCDDYISKPLDKDILIKKINQYIYN